MTVGYSMTGGLVTVGQNVLFHCSGQPFVELCTGLRSEYFIRYSKCVVIVEVLEDPERSKKIEPWASSEVPSPVSKASCM